MATEIQQQAYVLHKRPYRETSVLVTFFTSERGKQNAIIKGVRSASKTSKVKQAWLQPFQVLNISWLEKSVQQSDLVSLRMLEPGQVRFPLMGEANICGLYLNELLYRLMYPSVVSESVFQLYQQTLFNLAKVETRPEQAWVLRQFEFQLLSELGYGFDLEHDSTGQTIQSEQLYHFIPEYGFIPQESSGRINATVISGRCLEQFTAQLYSTECLAPLRQLFRQLLSHYLGDKPIQTRALFQN